MSTPAETFRTWANANKSGDMDVWSPLVADDFTYVHSGAMLETKPDLLEAFANGRRYHRWEIEELYERRYDGFAILNGVGHLGAGSGERRLEVDVRFTATLLGSGEVWQLASYQSTKLQD